MTNTTFTAEALAAAAHRAIAAADIGGIFRVDLKTGAVTAWGYCDYEDENNLYVTIWTRDGGHPVQVIRGTHYEPAYFTSERTFIYDLQGALDDDETEFYVGTLVNTSEPHTNDDSAADMHGVGPDGYPLECDCDNVTGWSTVTAAGSTIAAALETAARPATPVNIAFRYATSAGFSGDPVTAVFADYEESRDGFRTCYSHIGQHSSAGRSWVTNCTRPATPAEYGPLLSELQRAGYAVTVVQRVQWLKP